VQDLFDLIPRCSGIILNKFTMIQLQTAMNVCPPSPRAWRLYVVGQLYKAQDYDPRTRRARRKPMHSLAGPVERPRTARDIASFYHVAVDTNQREYMCSCADDGQELNGISLPDDRGKVKTTDSIDHTTN
jgi:hypothetical protein